MSDPDLEAAIDRAGREQVFALVRSVGWRYGDSIPKSVWYEAAAMVQKSRDGGFNTPETPYD